MNKNFKPFRISPMIIFLIFLVYACSDNLIGIVYPPDNSKKVTITEGVWGNVWFWEGNFMPVSPDGKITPVVREIYIHEATPHASVIRDSIRYPFIKTINSKYITKTVSDKDGFFQITLLPGKYSFFVKEDSLFFANITDRDGHLMSAEVDTNQIVKRQIDIDYRAAY